MQITIDLITGLLGSGKTTFILHYAREFIRSGKRICILANDYGAISVDRALLTEALGDSCDVEMVTAGDWDCFRRRFRTKLISMGMLGYDRVIVEPSGVFDADDFFQILDDSPIDRWYTLGNIICMVDAHLPADPDETQRYLFTSEAVNAGLLVVSRTQEIPGFPSDASVREMKDRILSVLHSGADQYHCSRSFAAEDILVADWRTFTDEIRQRVLHAGYRRGDMQKLPVAEDGSYMTLFYYHIGQPLPAVRSIVQDLLGNPEKYGKVFRVKGFFHAPKADNRPQEDSDFESGDMAHAGDGWYEMNATVEHIEFKPTIFRKEVVLVVGEHLNGKAVGLAFGETRSVTDYQV
ncbi:MAG: GTP-binding protein [Bilifractor sp.]